MHPPSHTGAEQADAVPDLPATMLPPLSWAVAEMNDLSAENSSCWSSVKLDCLNC